MLGRDDLFGIIGEVEFLSVCTFGTWKAVAVVDLELIGFLTSVKGSFGSYTPTSIDSGFPRSGSVTPTSTTFTLTDSRSDMMEDLEEVYTLRTERNCSACKELKSVLKQVWEEKAQVGLNRYLTIEGLLIKYWSIVVHSSVSIFKMMV